MKAFCLLFIALCVTQTYADISRGFKVAIPLKDLIQENLGKTFNEKIIDFFPTEDLVTELALPLPTLSSEEIFINLVRYMTDKVRDKIPQLTQRMIFDNIPALLAKKVAAEYVWYGLNDLRCFIEDGLAIFYFEALTEDEAWNGLPVGTIFTKRVRNEEDRDILKPLFTQKLLTVAPTVGLGSLIGYSLTGLSSGIGAGAIIGIHVGHWVYEYFYPTEIEEAYQQTGDDLLRGAYTKKPAKNPPGEEKARMQETIRRQQEEIEKLRQENERLKTNELMEL